MNLTTGISHSAELSVDRSLTVPKVSPHLMAFEDMPPVFATAYMVAFLEATCIELLAPHLDEGEHTVGVHVDVSHVAATPVGMSVKAHVELVEIAKRTLTFRVSAHDESGLIGEGLHKRAVIQVGKFMDAVNSKLDGQTSNRKDRFPDEPI